jgi:nicotinamidase/pyrazinamidase
MAQPQIVFWEVDTQADFMLAGGKLYVPGAEQIIPNIRRLVDAAIETGSLLVSSGDAHQENDPEFQRFPPHCLRGSSGARIIPEGLAKNPLTVPNDPAVEVPRDVLGHSQVVLEKQSLDVFDNPHAGEVVDRLGDQTEYVVFGVVTEYCVRCAAKGLLDRGRKVAIVRDAIRALEPEDGRRALEELETQGARLITTDEAVERIRSLGLKRPTR